MEDKIDLDELKREYFKFKKKYNLPEFSKLNEVFDVEEIDSRSEFLLRRIRREISERIAAYLRFFEVVLNPSNAPVFFFKIIKKLDSKDKEEIGKIYEKLGNLEVEAVKLDLDYKEEKEAEFIRKVFELFSDIRKDFLQVIDKMISFGNENKKEDKVSYFG